MKNAIVIAIKTSKDEDILGYYAGDSEETEVNKRCVIIYKPLCIRIISNVISGKAVAQYVTYPYFQYGGSLVTIPYDNILTKDVASEFFTMFYTRALGEYMVSEDEIHDRYTKLFEKRDFDEIMSETDSIFIDQKSEHKQ